MKREIIREIIIGAQWGDEGKGKITDLLAQKCNYVCRFNGGDNAGHTVVVNGTTFKFHMLPCGVLNLDCKVVIGNGCVVNITKLNAEIEQFEKIDPLVSSRVFVSERARVIDQCHLDRDFSRENSLGSEKLGTTMRGIGPCYEDKIIRVGRRIGDVDPKICNFQICDTSDLITSEIQTCNIIFEGANATMLDVDHGTWPFCTSSNCISGQVSIGLGIAPKLLKDVECVGVLKAYTTRSGNGPFPTEDFGIDGQRLQKLGCEFGTTTGRIRRCGWLDLAVVAYAHKLNGFSYLVLNKIDILDSFETVKIGIGYKKNCVSVKGMPLKLDDVEVVYHVMPGWLKSTSDCKLFEELPIEAQNFVKFIESFLDVYVKYIGNGPSRTDLIERK